MDISCCDVWYILFPLDIGAQILKGLQFPSIGCISYTRVFIWLWYGWVAQGWCCIATINPPDIALQPLVGHFISIHLISALEMHRFFFHHFSFFGIFFCDLLALFAIFVLVPSCFLENQGSLNSFLHSQQIDRTSSEFFAISQQVETVHFYQITLAGTFIEQQPKDGARVPY